MFFITLLTRESESIQGTINLLMLKSDMTVQSILVSPGLPLMPVETTIDCREKLLWAILLMLSQSLCKKSHC